MTLLAIIYPPKRPAETWVLAVDFSPELVTGESIQSRAVTSKRLADGANSSSTFLSGAAGGGPTSCTMRVVGGLHGETHRVTMTVTTTASPANVYSHEIDVPVEEG